MARFVPSQRLFRSRGQKGHRTHLFTSSHDPETLRSSVKVTAERTGPATVRLLLSPNRIGHAFPTGDLFRSLEVKLEEDSELPAQSSVKRVLSRHFTLEEQVRGHWVRVARSDDACALPCSLG